MKRDFPIFATLLLALLLIFSCGGYNTDLAREGGAYFDPEAVLPGKRIGYVLVRDRNGNVKSSARIERDCRTKNRIEGECSTRLLEGTVAMGLPDTLKYTVYHEDNLDVTVTFESSTGRQTGKVHGDNMVLNGEKVMPGKETRLNVETRIHKLPGPPPAPLMQIEYFSRLGIRVGSIHTTWVSAR